MKPFLKLFVIALVFFVLDFFLNPNLGTLFGYAIPWYSPAFDLLFLACYMGFFIIATDVSSEELDDIIEGVLPFVGGFLLVGIIFFLCQHFLHLDFLLPFIFIAALVMSLISILVFLLATIKDDKIKNFLFLPSTFSMVLLPLFIFAGIVPFVVIVWVPYLIICGPILFFTNADKISSWVTQK